ncbi:MAG: CDP-glycerol glycerophosphotransferase family protein [Ruminococcus sp.]|nr:CDP-glycerol glycerophosphotransferase family protein [Ruminococcus sp.]
MITIIISNNRMYSDLEITLKSLVATGVSADMLEIKVLDFVKAEDDCCDLKRFENLNIKFIDAYKTEPAQAQAQALQAVKGEYVLFANSGDVFSAGFFKAVNSVFNKNFSDKPKSIIAVKTIALPDYNNLQEELKVASKENTSADVNVIQLNTQPELVPTETIGVLFNTASLKKVGIKNELKLDALKNSMYEMLSKDEAFVSIGTPFLRSPYPIVSNTVNFLSPHHKYWYYDSLENFLLPLVKKHKKDNKTKAFIQYAALYELKWRYVYNQNSDNKHIVDNDFDTFLGLCKDILTEIDDNIIFNLSGVPAYRMVKGLCYALFNTKYGTDIESKYLLDNKNILRSYNDVVMMKANLLRVIIEIIEFENNKLQFEASVDDFMDMSNCELKCYLDGKEISITPTYRYAHTKYFGVSTNKRFTFKFEIPFDKITGKKQVINFFICHKGFSVIIPFTTRRYTSKISTGVSYSYWNFTPEGNSLHFENGNKDLVISKTKGTKRFVRELLMAAGMSHGSRRSLRMLITRTAYWLTRPYFKNKRIWLTYDKLYKGGDCGEYFYKYMLSQKDGITPAYVINKNCEDAKRLKKEGFKPLYFGTLKNRLYYLNAEVVFATHGGVHSFNGITNSQAKYVADLIHADVTCIQHGLSVQQLAQELNRVFNNTKRYYCASKYEIKNLEHPIYGYEDKSILRLTGIPRYDGLISDDKKQILITPTWRAYISMPPVMGQSRPYYPEFKNTNYFKIYHQLLSDEKLIETARKTGYKLIYLLHPIISSQIVDYPEIDGVEIIPATTVNYEKILTESSLMLTDYSGVQFDFAYMRKPVVYYHPPKLPPHYKEGGFFYDSMGFGEICTEHTQMVDCLCEYMENNCEMKPFYKDRADDFFAYSDQQSCKRIYDDMKEYLQNKNNN